MKKAMGLALALILVSGLGLTADAQTETFHAYVDSDLCAVLMLGPINDARVECSQSTHKDGSAPVLVRLSDNSVLEVNKKKMLKKLVGQFVSATGTVKLKSARMKLESVEQVEKTAIPAGSAGSELFDVRNFRARDDRLYEQVRHTLAMMPYISDFDFISFTMIDRTVILTGWTIRITNRSEAYRRVQRVEEVEKIVNNVQVLPMGSMDMSIRAGARVRLQRYLPTYFWSNGSDIKIVVKNGDIILLGVVRTQADSDLAYIQSNSVPGAFKVFNMLRVSKENLRKKG